MSRSSGKVLDIISFGNNFEDISRNRITLTNTNVEAVRGKFGEYGLYNGSDSLLTCAISSSLLITNAITIIGWIKTNVADNGILYKGDASENGDYGLRVDSSGFVRLILNDADRVTGTINVADDKWYHIAATYDKDAGGTTEGKIYINGNEDATGDYSTVIQTSSDALKIGRYHSATYTFDGILGDIKIYNIALDAYEVYKDYISRLPVSKYEVGKVSIS